MPVHLDVHQVHTVSSSSIEHWVVLQRLRFSHNKDLGLIPRQSHLPGAPNTWRVVDKIAIFDQYLAISQDNQD